MLQETWYDTKFLHTFSWIRKHVEFMNIEFIYTVLLLLFICCFFAKRWPSKQPNKREVWLSENSCLHTNRIYSIWYLWKHPIGHVYIMYWSHCRFCTWRPANTLWFWRNLEASRRAQTGREGGLSPGSIFSNKIVVVNDCCIF